MALDYQSIATDGWLNATASEDYVRIASRGYIGTASPPVVISGFINNNWFSLHAGLRLRGRQ